MSISNKQKIVIINRWDDQFADYTRYIDHDKYIVKYITDKTGAKINDVAAHDILIVNNLNDKSDMLNAAAVWAKSLQGIDKLLAMSEFDLEIAAYLREKLNISGIKGDEILRYRDKVVMKNLVVSAGINTPSYQRINDKQELDQVIANMHYPLIIKPRKGSSSQGTYKLSCAMDLKIIDHLVLNDYECEQFIEGNIYHVDGAIKNNHILFTQISRYINTCLDFSLGTPLGSVVIDNTIIQDKISHFTANVLRAISLSTAIFHLELIMQAKTEELYFLEIGARSGGGEIPYILSEIHGINMMELWSNLELDTEYKFILPDSLNKIFTGFLMIPKPIEIPCQVVKCESLKPKINNMYFELIVEAGHVFVNRSGYEGISGRFRYIGANSKEIETAILNTIQHFHMVVNPITNIINERRY